MGSTAHKGHSKKMRSSGSDFERDEEFHEVGDGSEEEKQREQKMTEQKQREEKEESMTEEKQRDEEKIKEQQSLPRRSCDYGDTGNRNEAGICSPTATFVSAQHEDEQCDEDEEEEEDHEKEEEDEKGKEDDNEKKKEKEEDEKKEEEDDKKDEAEVDDINVAVPGQSHPHQPSEATTVTPAAPSSSLDATHCDGGTPFCTTQSPPTSGLPDATDGHLVAVGGSNDRETEEEENLTVSHLIPSRRPGDGHRQSGLLLNDHLHPSWIGPLAFDQSSVELGDYAMTTDTDKTTSFEIIDRPVMESISQDSPVVVIVDEKISTDVGIPKRPSATLECRAGTIEGADLRPIGMSNNSNNTDDNHNHNNTDYDPLACSVFQSSLPAQKHKCSLDSFDTPPATFCEQPSSDANTQVPQVMDESAVPLSVHEMLSHEMSAPKRWLSREGQQEHLTPEPLEKPVVQSQQPQTQQQQPQQQQPQPQQPQPQQSQPQQPQPQQPQQQQTQQQQPQQQQPQQQQPQPQQPQPQQPQPQQPQQQQTQQQRLQQQQPQPLLPLCTSQFYPTADFTTETLLTTATPLPSQVHPHISSSDKSVLTSEQQMALKFKEEGNEYFKAGDMEQAVECYSHGIELEPENHILYSNRSAAYSRLPNHSKALQDSEACIQIEPTFLKGHSRRTCALLALGRHLEAIQAADLGLSFAAPADDFSTKLLETNRTTAQRLLLHRAISGRWTGGVDPVLGGYDQTFAFASDSNHMLITIMDRQTNARFVIHPTLMEGNSRRNKHLLGMDITAVPEVPTPLLDPPTVPYIFQLYYTDPRTGEKTEYRGTTALPSPVDPAIRPPCSTGEASVPSHPAGEWDQQLQWEMHLCSPFMSMSRPDRFEGPGFLIMRKCHHPEAPRLISNEISNLSFDEQLHSFFTELLQLRPDPPIEEPSMDDDQATSASKIGSFMRYQTQVHALSKTYPDPVSVIAEQLFASPEQFSHYNGESTVATIERRATQLESLSLSTRHLFEATKVHLQTSGLHLCQLSVAPTIAQSPSLEAFPSSLSARASSPVVGTTTESHRRGGSQNQDPKNPLRSTMSKGAELRFEPKPTHHSKQQRGEPTSGPPVVIEKPGRKKTEPIDQPAKTLLDQLAEHQKPKPFTTWCMENKVLIGSAVVLTLSVGFAFCLFKRRQSVAELVNNHPKE